MQRCNSCGRDLPLTAEYFYRSKGNRTGLQYTCKKCVNQAKKKRLRDIKSGRIEVATSTSRLIHQALKLKDIHKKRYSKGKYKVDHWSGMEKRNMQTFIGTLSDQTDLFITLENKHGVRECFLKADFMIDNKIEKVK